MPTLTIKAEFVEKLKKLDCYDQFLSNLKAQWDYTNDTTGTIVSITEYQKMALCSWEMFILSAFCWSETPENHSYWNKIQFS